MSGAAVEQDRIKIEIDEQWSAAEFAELFSQVAYLYKIAAFGEVRIDGQTSIFFDPLRRLGRRREFYDAYYPIEFELEDEAYDSRRRVEHLIEGYFAGPMDQMKVDQIHYGSPGFVDLVGLGRVVREVRIFLLAVMDRFIHREDREIARASATQDVIAQKIKNAENLLKLSEKAGLDPSTRQALVREVLTVDLYVEGKILSQQIRAVK
jgi:hypothetical protein